MIIGDFSVVKKWDAQEEQAQAQQQAAMMDKAGDAIAKGMGNQMTQMPTEVMQ